MSRKNRSVPNFQMRFSTTYSCCPGEPKNHSRKGLLHWIALQLDFQKMSFWQTALVGYILPCQRCRPSLFRNNLSQTTDYAGIHKFISIVRDQKAQDCWGIIACEWLDSGHMHSDFWSLEPVVIIMIFFDIRSLRTYFTAWYSVRSIRSIYHLYRLSDRDQDIIPFVSLTRRYNFV